MFLTMLNEEEKTAFMELSHFLAACDNITTEEEAALLQEYMKEMGFQAFTPENDSKSLSDILEVFSKSSESNRRAMFLEIVALVMSDFEFNDDEKAAIAVIMDAWEISEETFATAQSWVVRMQSLYKEANKFVYG